MSETANVWLIEDNAAFRRAVAAALEVSDEFHCAQSFRSLEDALATKDRAAPQVILLDIGLPGRSGLEGIPMLRQSAPGAAIIILTVFEDEEKIVRAICAGAAGYLLKSSSLDEIVQALRSVLTGGAAVTPRVARRVLDLFTQLNRPPGDYGLTPREREILQLAVQGLTKKEIAARLDCSIHTADTHLRHIYEKLHVNTRSGAVAKALNEKLV
jgi:DNA-binding NarL/FixJ family response regulator